MAPLWLQAAAPCRRRPAASRDIAQSLAFRQGIGRPAVPGSQTPGPVLWTCLHQGSRMSSAAQGRRLSGLLAIRDYVCLDLSWVSRLSMSSLVRPIAPQSTRAARMTATVVHVTMRETAGVRL